MWGKSLPALRCMLQYICIRIYYTDARLLTTNNENTLGKPYVQLNTERKISLEILISEKKIKRHKERKLEQGDSGKKIS